MEKKCAVFLLLGQSNAVGHGVPMAEEDKISSPMKNVFGLSREKNQSFRMDALQWSGYTSGGMNLGEEQDHTYSVANCLASLWQSHIDGGNAYGLGDLYIVQIAIGAQGVTEGYMWHPEREERLIPGVLGTADISLFPFTMHVLSLLDKSFRQMGREYEVIGLHWRGGENDVTASTEVVERDLFGIYTILFDGFLSMLGRVPVVLHRIACPDRMTDMDPTGEYLCRMHKINGVFERLAERYECVTIYDPTTLPQYVPDVRGNGIFIEDAVHYTPEVNRCVAEKILQDHTNK